MARISPAQITDGCMVNRPSDLQERFIAGSKLGYTMLRFGFHFLGYGLFDRGVGRFLEKF